MKPWGTHKRVPTPGMWAPGSPALDRRSGRFIRPLTGGASICQVTVHRRNWRENARLIAVSPMMLEFVKASQCLCQPADAECPRCMILHYVDGTLRFPQPDPWRCASCDKRSQEVPDGCNHKEEPDEGA